MRISVNRRKQVRNILPVQKKGPFPQPCTCLLVPLNSDIHIYEFWTFNYIIHMSSFPSLVVLLRRITRAATGEATSLEYLVTAPFTGPS
jgi:hypothetical protein